MVAGLGRFYVAYRVAIPFGRTTMFPLPSAFRTRSLHPSFGHGSGHYQRDTLHCNDFLVVEQQTFDMKYQEEKDELERQAMLRDPARLFW